MKIKLNGQDRNFIKQLYFDILWDLLNLLKQNINYSLNSYDFHKDILLNLLINALCRKFYYETDLNNSLIHANHEDHYTLVATKMAIIFVER